MANWHVISRDDLKAHTIGLPCKCGPTMEPQANGNRLWTHYAFDGREFYEEEASEMESARLLSIGYREDFRDS